LACRCRRNDSRIWRIEILFVGIGYFRKKRQAYAWFKKSLARIPLQIVHDHAEMASTFSLKNRPRWAEIRIVIGLE